MEPRHILPAGIDGVELTPAAAAARLRMHAPLGRADADEDHRVPRRGDNDLNPGLVSTVGEWTEAAVLIPLVAREAGLQILLTRRTAHLSDHAGQIAFPGGRIEAWDASPESAALREAEEEVGLDPGTVEIVGQLDAYLTRTGYHVTPIVGLLDPPSRLRADAFEVAEVFEVPLAFFLDPKAKQIHSRRDRDRERFYYAFPYGDYYIWGATAGMLVNLVDILERPK